MGLSPWEELSGELAEPLFENVSQKLAYPNVLNEEKPKAPRLVAGFSWAREAMRRFSAAFICAVVHSFSKSKYEGACHAHEG